MSTKVSRPVLRGPGPSNGVWLLGESPTRQEAEEIVNTVITTKSDTKRGHRDAHASRVDDRSIPNSDRTAQDPSEFFSLSLSQFLSDFRFFL
jgi:hypothetical protein